MLVVLCVLGVLVKTGDASGKSDHFPASYEFDGDRLNSSIWTSKDWGTHGPTELQLYLAEEASVSNGVLTLRTRFNPQWCLPSTSAPSCTPSNASTPGAKQYNYTSAWVDTEHKFKHRFGRFEVRAKLPDPRSWGTWPAHWLMPEPETSDPPNVCWPVGGEIDIMESYGNSYDQWGNHHNGSVYGTYHWATDCGKDMHCGGSTPAHRCAPYNYSGMFPTPGEKSYPIDFSQDFHIFAVEWNETSIRWYVDGAFYWERHNGDRAGTDHSAKITTNPMYFILNTAINPGDLPPPGTPSGTPRPMPVYHVVDWVRVYEPQP